MESLENLAAGRIFKEDTRGQNNVFRFLFLVCSQKAQTVFYKETEKPY